MELEIATTKNRMQHQRLLSLEGVSRSFVSGGRKFDALKNISLVFQRGEYVAITGKSGSGKSTLLHMLTGIDRPDHGRVLFAETEISNMDENSLAKWRGANIGIVFQFFQLIPTLTILENILLAMEFVAVIPAQKRTERAVALLRQTGIEKHKDKMPASLSGGEQQRAAIARALANDPPVIVADEPTGNLDSKTGEEIQRLFADLVQKGKTIIVVTHEKTEQSGYHRIIRIADGVLMGGL